MTDPGLLEGLDDPLERTIVKVKMSTKLISQWASRDVQGYLLTWDWGEPDHEGFYTPTVTRHLDDQLVPSPHKTTNWFGRSISW